MTDTICTSAGSTPGAFPATTVDAVVTLGVVVLAVVEVSFFAENSENASAPTTAATTTAMILFRLPAGFTVEDGESLLVCSLDSIMTVLQQGDEG